MRPAHLELSGPAAGSTRWAWAPRRASIELRCGADGRAAASDGPALLGQWDEPLAALRWMASTFPCQGRWVGYLSYDLGRWFEDLPATAADDLSLPLLAFAFVPEGALPALPALSARLPSARRSKRTWTRDALTSTFSRDGYQSAVRRCIDYVAAGDVFQVNLSQRFTVPLRSDALGVYRRLQADAPAAFGGLLDFGDFALVCNSPELFLRITPDPATGNDRGDHPGKPTGRRRVVTRPIKGTRPRSPGMEAELRDSIKDQAELNMIVDLERNDLGRVCEIGSVKVTEPRAIEAHPTVYHGVAAIEGVLRDDVGFVDLLRATFPGGSVTGAPKIRAMQIIEELEPVRRGPYCGAIGYLSADGHAQFNVAIRTILVKDGLAHVPVGGGIVADSDPVSEYEETLVKARAMFAALGVSARQGRGAES